MEKANDICRKANSPRCICDLLPTLDFTTMEKEGKLQRKPLLGCGKLGSQQCTNQKS